ncbi:MAG TPA: hypothetical protein ENH34_04075 [Phycisphaerales bacterium]|nr:hypothetical protein [Phycisphaerales bacterium]
MIRKRNLLILLVIVAAIAVGAFAAESTITVYYDKELGQINKLVFGNNFLGHGPMSREPLGESSSIVPRVVSVMDYGAGIWDPKRKKPVKEVIDLAKETGLSIARFPGGCGTHLYDWKKTIGPEREHFLYGLDEFMKTAEQIGAEVVMTASYYTGDANDAADLVEYLNAANDGSNPNGGTDWAAERAKNGHPAPYNVKYFEVGNETWGSHPPKVKKISPGQYARRYLKYYEAMKKTDPSIQIGAVLFWSSSWNRKVTSIVKDKVDFGIQHTYPSPRVDREKVKKMAPKEVFRISLASPVLRDENRYPDFLKLLKKNAGRDIPLAITEYNGGFTGLHDPAYRHSLTAALVNAELLRIFMKPEYNILMANYWQFSNSYWGMIKAEGDGFYFTKHSYPKPIKYTKRPNYYPYQLYNRHFGEVLIDTDVRCDSYRIEDVKLIEYEGNIKELMRNMKSMDVPFLSVNASKSRDGSKVYLMVINKNTDESITSSIDLKGFIPAERADAWVLNGPNVEATNEDNPDNVKVVHRKFDIKDSPFAFTFEPHSLTAIEIVSRR